MSKKKQQRRGNNRVGLILAIAFLALVIAVVVSSIIASQPPSWITVEHRDVLGDQRASQAIKAASQWADMYGGCGRTVTLRPYTSQENITMPNDTHGVTLEDSGPGYIGLGPDGNARNLALHAMTHACGGDLVTLPKPLPFDDGVITGFQGLSLQVTLTNGKQTWYRTFEEGVAERNASYVASDYEITSMSYYHVGELARHDFPRNDNSVVTDLEHSDVYSFVGAIIHKPANEVTADDINSLMHTYSAAWQQP